MTWNFAMIIPSFKFLEKDLILSIKRIYILCATVALCIVWSRQDGTYFCSNVSKAVNLEMDDPYLVEFIRMCRMQLPSNKQYKFRNKGMDNAKIVLNDLYLGYSHFWADAVFLSQSLVPKGKQTKRYFECGASDGEFMSQSYFSERFLDWSGILVEADQIYFDKMVETNRKSTKLQLCASKSTKSNVMSFLHTDKGKVNNKEYLYPGSGRIFEGEIPEVFENQPNILVDVFCAPVYTMLLATNALSLDVFYLDIEGAELEVLKSLPFDKIDIAIFVVEYNEDQEKFNDLKVFFEEKEYHLADYSIIDALFIKNEYVENTKTNISGKEFYDEVKKWSKLKPLKD